MSVHRFFAGLALVMRGSVNYFKYFPNTGPHLFPVSTSLSVSPWESSAPPRGSPLICWNGIHVKSLDRSRAICRADNVKVDPHFFSFHWTINGKVEFFVNARSCNCLHVCPLLKLLFFSFLDPHSTNAWEYYARLSRGKVRQLLSLQLRKLSWIILLGSKI